MQLLGFEIRRVQKQLTPPLTPLSTSGGGWWPLVRESFTGAWQHNVTLDRQTVVSYSTVWACVTLIAADISKLWLKLVAYDERGLAVDAESAAFSPVLRKPNHYQTRVKFFEYWVLCKLLTGNTYVLKERDNRGVVVALYVLDPQRVQVLVSPSGDVFYQLQTDTLSGLEASSLTVPAREVIHDICVPLYHPLVGVSPIYACGLAALQGLRIQESSARFFANGSQISGILSAPGKISDDTAQRLRELWTREYLGEANAGKVAVVGDGLKFEPMTMTAVDAQLIEQLKWTSENVCACFHVPGYMVGIGPPPPYTDLQSINLQYYTQALQNPIENLETLLTEGLELPKPYGVEFDLKALVRMDSKTQMETASKGVNAGVLTPNEARADFDLQPVAGGDQPYLQQQYWPLEALSERATPQPVAAPTSPAPPPMSAVPEAKAISEADIDREFALVRQEVTL